MLYFSKNMSHKLVAHFAEVVRPLESAVDSCYTCFEGCYTDLPRNYSRLKLHIHTHTHYCIYIYIRKCIFKGRFSLIDTDFAKFAVT